MGPVPNKQMLAGVNYQGKCTYTHCHHPQSRLGNAAGTRWKRQEGAAHTSLKAVTHRLVEVDVLKEKACHQVHHEERLEAQLAPKEMRSRPTT